MTPQQHIDDHPNRELKLKLAVATRHNNLATRQEKGNAELTICAYENADDLLEVDPVPDQLTA